MQKSVLDAIKEGFWEFEPAEVDEGDYDPTDAMPGTKSKLHIMAERLRAGLPLWHSEDRNNLDAPGRPVRVNRPR